MLTFYVSTEHQRWDAMPPFLTFVYNTAAQSTTKYSQFSLLQGQEPVSMMDSTFSYSGVSDNFTLANTTCRFELFRQIANTRTDDTQEAAKLRYDAQYRYAEYADGALVWF